eukprot:INCI15388.2.p1 GENE.INCI15388.2~~INCI15388.2.p1  ORF type:complete len:553 (+),score=92.72 INCI15388.2:163-1821(+)
MPKKAQRGKKKVAKGRKKAANGGQANATVVASLLKKIEANVNDQQKWKNPKSSLATHEGMYRDLGLLAARQEPLSSTKRPASEQDQAEVCQHLVEWVLSAVPEDKREAMTSMLEVRPSDENPNEGNAVFAKRDIALNELVMTVPRNRNISVTTAVNSPLVRLVASKFPFVLNTPVVLLALQLCAEAMLGDESTYKEYIAVLPSEFSIPLFFAPLTLKQLIGSTALDNTLKHYRNVVKHYCVFAQLMANTPEAKEAQLHRRFTWALFSWAIAVVMTRQNQIPIAADVAPKTDDAASAEAPTGEEPSAVDADEAAPAMELALVPLFDMVNHEESEAGRITSDFKDDALVLYAKRNFKAGEQVRMYYGQRRSELFLQYSGFVPVDRTLDSMTIQLSLNQFFDAQDPLIKAKRVVLANCGLRLFAPEGSIVVCALSSVGSVSPELAALCRLRAAGKPEMTQLMKKGGVQRVDQIPSLNVINELHCVRGVRQIISGVQAKFPTTLEETDKKLTSKSMSFIDRQVLLLRRAELRILRNVLKVLAGAEEKALRVCVNAL